MNFDHAYFEQDRENIAKKLDIGKEIIYLTKPECENIGLTRDDILDITKKTLISHGKKEFEMPAKIGVHPWTEVFFPCNASLCARTKSHWMQMDRMLPKQSQKV